MLRCLSKVNEYYSFKVSAQYLLSLYSHLPLQMHKNSDEGTHFYSLILALQIFLEEIVSMTFSTLEKLYY